MSAHLGALHDFFLAICVLTRPPLHRYLRASKWVLDNAIQRLENTLLWRREFGVYDLVTAEHVEPEVRLESTRLHSHPHVYVVGRDG